MGHFPAFGGIVTNIKFFSIVFGGQILKKRPCSIKLWHKRGKNYFSELSQLKANNYIDGILQKLCPHVNSGIISNECIRHMARSA